MKFRAWRGASAVVAALILGGMVSAGSAGATTTGGTITGRATDVQSSQGITGICVDAWGTSGLVGGAQTDLSGNYTLNVPAGSYLIVFNNCQSPNNEYVMETFPGVVGFSSDKGTHVTVADGGSVSNVSVTMFQGGTVSGTITNPKGQGLVNFVLFPYLAHVDSNKVQIFTQYGTFTNKLGFYSITGVPNGSAKLNAGKGKQGAFYNDQPGFFKATVFTVQPNQTTSNINFVFPS
jgi:hypothetical protein